MKFHLTSTQILNIVCFLLILVMIVMLFTPYWQYESTKRVDGEKVTTTNDISINDYVWFPRDHRDMTKVFEGLYEDKDDFWINDLVLAPALLLVAGLIVGIISLFYSKTPMTAIVTLILGGLNSVSYLTRPEMALGSGHMLHMIISLVATAFALVATVWGIYKMVLQEKKKHGML